MRQAGSAERATARGLLEFPAGLEAVVPVGLPALAAMAAEGAPLPVSVRHRLEVYKAVQREKAKTAAKAEALCDKARAAREEERTQREGLKAQEKAERAVEKKRYAAAERRALGKAEKEAAPPAAVAAPSLVVDVNDTRLPWED